MPEPDSHSGYDARQVAGYVAMGLIGVARAFFEWRKMTSRPISLFPNGTPEVKEPIPEVIAPTEVAVAIDRRFTYIEQRLCAIEKHNGNQEEWQLTAHKDNQASNQRILGELENLRTALFRLLGSDKK